MRTITIFIFFSLFSANVFSQVFKFKSTETDVESPGKKTYTKYETCYHTLDYDARKIILESTNSKGEKVKIIYPMKSFYQDGVTSVIVVNSNGVKEFWFSPEINNLGYDLADGTRLACYKITKLK
jgi:hypothetical protein